MVHAQETTDAFDSARMHDSSTYKSEAIPNAPRRLSLFQNNN